MRSTTDIPTGDLLGTFGRSWCSAGMNAELCRSIHLRRGEAPSVLEVQVVLVER